MLRSIQNRYYECRVEVLKDQILDFEVTKEKNNRNSYAGGRTKEASADVGLRAEAMGP